MLRYYANSMTISTIEPVTADRWPDLQALFSQAGVCRNCYCMAWRKPRREFEAGRGAGNRDSMAALVQRGPAPGLLAYDEAGTPVGWISVAPRSEFVTLARSRVWAAVDNEPGVWSITCFFVAKPWRGRGLTARLIRAATQWAFQHGARVVEGYPIDPAKRQPDTFMWTGLAAAFRAAGFVEAARRSAQKPIMRCAILPQDC